MTTALNAPIIEYNVIAGLIPILQHIPRYPLIEQRIVEQIAIIVEKVLGIEGVRKMVDLY